MKKLLISIALPMIMKELRKNKSSLVKEINKKLDLPMLSEEKEEKFFNAIFDALLMLF